MSPADLGAWEPACDKSGTVPPGAAPLSSGCGRVLTCSDKMARWNAVGVQGPRCMRVTRLSWTVEAEYACCEIRMLRGLGGQRLSMFRAIRAYAATPLEHAAGLRQLIGQESAGREAFSCSACRTLFEFGLGGRITPILPTARSASSVTALVETANASPSPENVPLPHFTSP
jgi:hypothetical protein